MHPGHDPVVADPQRREDALLDVTADDHVVGAGIGGGYVGAGGTTTVNGGTVTATGGPYATGIGGGYDGSGGTIAIDGGTVTATGGSAVGAGGYSTEFGSLLVSGGVLRVPSGFLQVPDSTPGVEVAIGPDGVLDGSAGPDASYATITENGQIDNGGRILLPTWNVTDNGVTVADPHYAVSLDIAGGSTAPDAVTVFADTFDHGGRVFPADPTRPGATFLGWNTAADGSGDPVTATSTPAGSSATGTPVPVTAYAQWLAPAVTEIAPASGPITGGTAVVITGTDFTGATSVRFGAAGEATSFTVDSETQITATAPSSATTGTRHIRVTTPDGTSTAVTADRYIYNAPAPAVTGIAPASAIRRTRHIRITTPTGGISPAVTADRHTWR